MTSEERKNLVTVVQARMDEVQNLLHTFRSEPTVCEKLNRRLDWLSARLHILKKRGC